MVKALAFTARFTSVEDGKVQATVDELPGVVTTGGSHQEAECMLVDALHAYLLSLGDLHDRGEPPCGGQIKALRITVSV